jgi:phage N-6-adenine-methyltransferase
MSIVPARTGQQKFNVPALLDAAEKAIAQLSNAVEAKQVIDRVVGLRAFAKAANDRDMYCRAGAVRLMSERRWGQLYTPAVKAKGTKGQKLQAGPGRGKKGKTGGHRIGNHRFSDQLPTLKSMGVTKRQSVKWCHLAQLSEEKFNARLKMLENKVAASTTSMPGSPKPAFTGVEDWHTPPEYLEVAREALGAIDLDPASSAKAQKNVKATKFYSIKDDGLKHEWHGKVFCNPPYKQPAIMQFVKKLIEQIAAGHTTHAILLTHNFSETEWYRTAAATCSAICFPIRRIQFVNAEGERAQPQCGQVFFYFGDDVERFVSAFETIGYGFRSSGRWLHVVRQDDFAEAAE